MLLEELTVAFQNISLNISNVCLWRRPWHPTPVLLPGKSHGRRSLVGCSPWGPEESDTTEWLHPHFHALEKDMATHSSVLAWRILGMGEPGGLPFMGSHRVRHNWSDLAAGSHICLYVFLFIFVSQTWTYHIPPRSVPKETCCCSN